MNLSAGLIGLTLALQVPPPTSASDASRPFRQEHQAILDREAKALKDLADRLEKESERARASEVRKLLPTPPPADGSQRFVPLPEVDFPRLDLPEPTTVDKEKVNEKEKGGEGLGDWPKPLSEIRSESAASLLALANRAATEQPRHFALADACLREVLVRAPNHAEARRLLGFVRHNGGWVTPHALRQFDLGNTQHPVYGWVSRSWVPHLENGELPGLVVSGVPKAWLPADRADALRRRYPDGWRIDTEHFHIQTNVPLSEAIAFGGKLEHLHELFQSEFADVIGEGLPLARRYRSKAGAEAPEEPRHDVSYFASRKEFNDYLRPFEGSGISKSLGIYYPPGILPRSTRGHAYFFRDTKGELPVTATLYHEVSHQLLWESGIAGPNDYLGNDGNYWVFEGLGTYFETLAPQADGSIQIGGLVGPRNEEARATFTRGEGKLVPLDRFLGFDKRAFNHRVDIYRHYQQASALTTFLLHGEGGAHREAFLDYVRDAASGRVRRTSGLGLPERLGRSPESIDSAFLQYLKGSPSD